MKSMNGMRSDCMMLAPKLAVLHLLQACLSTSFTTRCTYAAITSADFVL